MVVPRTGEAKFPMTPVQYLLLSLLSSAGKILHHGTYTEAAEQFKTTKFGRQVLLSFLSQSSKLGILLHFADVISKTSFAGYRVINVWTHTDKYKWSVGHPTFGWKGEGVTLMPVVYILTPYFYSFSAVNPPNTPIAIMTRTPYTN